MRTSAGGEPHLLNIWRFDRNLLGPRLFLAQEDAAECYQLTNDRYTYPATWIIGMLVGSYWFGTTVSMHFLSQWLIEWRGAGVGNMGAQELAVMCLLHARSKPARCTYSKPSCFRRHLVYTSLRSATVPVHSNQFTPWCQSLIRSSMIYENYTPWFVSRCKHQAWSLPAASKLQNEDRARRYPRTPSTF